MLAIRHEEQNTASVIGGYAAMFQLGYPSSTVKSPSDPSLQNDLLEILSATRPDVVYTHNPADKHDTHIGASPSPPCRRCVNCRTTNAPNSHRLRSH